MIQMQVDWYIEQFEQELLDFVSKPQHGHIDFQVNVKDGKVCNMLVTTSVSLQQPK